MAYALVTGAAKGIGKYLAAELAERKYHVLITDIDGSNLDDTAHWLQETYSVEVHALRVDLTAPGAFDAIAHWTKPFDDQLQIVINNAGFGLTGPFDELPLDEQLDIVDVVVKAQMVLSYHYIPILKRQSRAHLMNVASTAAFQAVPYFNIYAAAKAFSLSFTRSLSYELRNTTVRVSCLCPGATDTAFIARARMAESTVKAGQKVNVSPAEVAKRTIPQMLKGRVEIVPGWLNKLHAFLPKFFPKRLAERVGGGIYEHKAPLPPRPVELEEQGVQ